MSDPRSCRLSLLGPLPDQSHCRANLLTGFPRHPDRRRSRRSLCWGMGIVLAAAAATLIADEPPRATRDGSTSAETDVQAEPWQSLFDGKSLAGWSITQFGGQGDVTVTDQQLVLGFGSSLTGITSTRTDLPHTNYEIRLEAKRQGGSDFFCGLTFPVGNSHCSLIVGGWGGALVGLSSLDGVDASENETQRSMVFRKQTWYGIRLRVTDRRIQVWIDDKRIIDQVIEGREISVRPEVELSRPLGICTWETQAALRNLAIRRFPASLAE